MDKDILNYFNKMRGPFSSEESYKIYLVTFSVKYVEDNYTDYLPSNLQLRNLIKNPDSIKYDFQKTLSFIEESIPFLSNVFPSLKIHWDNISDKVLYEMLIQLEAWNIESFEVINQSLRLWRERSSGRNIDNITPSSLQQLMVGILQMNEGKSFYDGTAGTAGLMNEAIRRSHTKDLDLYGQELNPDTWAIGKLHLLLGGLTEAYFEIGDTLIAPIFTEGSQVMKFDYLAMNPPIGLRISDYQKELLDQDVYRRFYYGEIPKTSVDYGFIQHALASLNDSGRGVIVVSNGPLTRTTKEMEIRNRIVRSDQLEAIISLGSNILDYTAIPMNLMILNKNKSSKKSGKIQFIQAKEYYVQRGRKYEIASESILEIIEILNKAEEIEGVSKLVALEDIHPETLNVEAYLQDDLIKVEDEYYQLKLDTFNAQKNLKQLEKVAKVYRGYNATPKNTEETPNGVFRLIRTSDVQENQLLIESVEKVRINVSFNEDQYLVQPGDVILSARGQQTKVAVIPELEEKYILSQSFIGIRPQGNNVDPYFLKAYFESPLGQFQIQQSMSGSTIPVISPKMLSAIQLPLPPLEEQKEIGNQYLIALESYRATIKEAQLKLDTKKTNIYNAMDIGKMFKNITDK